MKDKWETITKFDEDTKNCEISVIQKDNKYGHESWGKAGLNKIILFTDIEFNSKQEIQWALKVAMALSDALNKNNL